MTDLKETEKLMESNDYRERFKAEYWQTKIRLSKLETIIKNYDDSNFVCKTPK